MKKAFLKLVLTIMIAIVAIFVFERLNNKNVTIEKPAYTELTTYTFRTSYLRKEHFDKHGKEMGFKNEEAYEKRANEVINNEEALIKSEKEDGDYVYYIVDTNEIVFLSRDGYIRTYFKPDGGKRYFDSQ